MNKTFKNKHKLTPEVHKEIKTIAQKLPRFQRVDAKGKPMTRIITKHVRTEKIDETQVRNHYQKIEEPLFVNHELNLIEVFKKDGMPGIESYVSHFERIQQEHDERVKAEAEAIKKEEVTNE